MAQSFTAETSGPLASPEISMRRNVLVTGAAGNIGSYFAEHAYRRYHLRLMIRPGETGPKVDALRPLGEVIEADLADLAAMKAACEGMDTVLHLAGDPNASAVWESLLSANIIGTYNTLIAAKSAGCRRVVYASSIHAVSGYPADVQVKTTDPVNPGDLYGVSKCFAEAFCRYMAEKEDLSCIVIRIGAFQPAEAAASEGGISMLDAFVSQRDLHQLLEKSIDVGELRFAIFHGLSDNRFKRLDISDAREILGYHPVDDLTRLNPSLRELGIAEKVVSHNVEDERQESGIREELSEARQSSAGKTDPEGKGSETRVVTGFE